MATVRTGIETIMESPPSWLEDHRIGLLCNPASVDRHLNHTRILIHNLFPKQIKALFFPQHGFFAEKQDNMIESGDIIDPILQVPAFSLYGDTRRPDKQMFDLIDTLIIDLQDVGTRVYTFMSTISYCLEAAKLYQKNVLVLDRPNPVGGHKIEGNCLKSAFSSFVGRYPIPMRHGLTVAELTHLINDHFSIGSHLQIVPMKGWKRYMFFSDTGLPWVAPSPNLPTPYSALVYPGQVLWEGTNLSEGRGTTQPFEIFGGPFVDPGKLISSLGGKEIPGGFLREIAFEPTSNKWNGFLCHGLQIHVLQPNLYNSYETSLRLLQATMATCGKDFQWKPPPYEYEFEKLPIDLIMGDADIRKRLGNFEDPSEIIDSWQADLGSFKSLSKRYHLYD